MYSIKFVITGDDAILVRTIVLDPLRKPLEARYFEPDSFSVFVQLPSVYEGNGSVVIWIESFEPLPGDARRMEFAFDPPQTIQTMSVSGIMATVTIDYTNEDFSYDQTRLVNL